MVNADSNAYVLRTKRDAQDSRLMSESLERRFATLAVKSKSRPIAMPTKSRQIWS